MKLNIQQQLNAMQKIHLTDHYTCLKKISKKVYRILDIELQNPIFFRTTYIIITELHNHIRKMKVINNV